MNVRDYAAIAQVIRDRLPRPLQAYYGLTVCNEQTLAIIAQELASLFLSRDAKFNQGAFLAACGVNLNAPQVRP